jgi:hypothetical protein
MPKSGIILPKRISAIAMKDSLGVNSRDTVCLAVVVVRIIFPCTIFYFISFKWPTAQMQGFLKFERKKSSITSLCRNKIRFEHFSILILNRENQASIFQRRKGDGRLIALGNFVIELFSGYISERNCIPGLQTSH